MPKHTLRSQIPIQSLIVALNVEIDGRQIRQKAIAHGANMTQAHLSRVLSQQVNPSVGLLAEIGAAVGMELMWRKK